MKTHPNPFSIFDVRLLASLGTRFGRLSTFGLETIGSYRATPPFGAAAPNPKSRIQNPKFHHLPLLVALTLLAAALVPAAAAAPPAPDIPQRQRQTPAAIRVVTANIRFLLPADEGTGNEWDKRKQLARDVLLAQDADIICFQEFRDPHHAYLKKHFAGYELSGFVEGERGRTANAIYHSKKRFKKVSMDGAFLSPAPGEYRSKFPESSSVRSVTRLHLKDRQTGRDLLIWNTHLDHKYQAGRDKQAAVLAGFLKKQPPGAPQIVTGDFNCAAKTEAIQTIKSAGFTDTYTALHGPEDPGYTYHNFLGHKYNKPHGKIDFILCTGALRPTAAEIIRDNRANHYPSDHYFISAELEYTTPPSLPAAPAAAAPPHAATPRRPRHPTRRPTRLAST
jgi:endonuclease/exonuclease/phosphatase family metal-dependent hydrolase